MVAGSAVRKSLTDDPDPGYMPTSAMTSSRGCLPTCAVSPHAGWVRSVAAAELDGRAVIISGSNDRTVRVWDLATGTPVGAPIAGHNGMVLAATAAELDMRPVIRLTGAARRGLRHGCWAEPSMSFVSRADLRVWSVACRMWQHSGVWHRDHSRRLGPRGRVPTARSRAARGREGRSGRRRCAPAPVRWQ